MSVFASSHVFRINKRTEPPSAPVAQPVTCAPHAAPQLHNQLQVHLMSPPPPQLQNQLQVHFMPPPSCTTSYRCTSCRPQLHNQLQVHFIPPPVAQPVTGALVTGCATGGGMKCTSCRPPIAQQIFPK